MANNFLTLQKNNFGEENQFHCQELLPPWLSRVAQSAGIGELDSSIAKDLIDSEDPKHTLFCRKKRICREKRAFKG